MATPITARDAAAAQRLWQNRELSDGDVDRVLADLVAVTAKHDRAGQIVRQLAAVWPKDLLRQIDEFVEATKPAPIKSVERSRW